MKNKILPAIAFVVLIVAAISIVHTQPEHQTHEPPVAPPRTDFRDRVAAVGLIEASTENISLGSHLSGVVERVFVVAGQDVEQGAPLIKLDTRALEAALAERKSDLASRDAAVKTAEARARKANASLDEVKRTLHFAESVADPRSISAEEVTRRRSAVEVAEAEVQSAEAEIVASKAAVDAARSAIAAVQTDLDRSVVNAPVAGRILQVRIRVGEYAAAGPSPQPWLVMGCVTPLHVRVDVDEHEAWRVSPEASAIAQVRGNAELTTPLKFVRFEPYVVPKESLTGASTERVDTRVMQAIYRVERHDLPLFVGQQMDVFIEASPISLASK